MILLKLLAATGFALQCSASLLPGTPKPEVEDNITGDLVPWENNHATPPPPDAWDRDFELINPRITPEGDELFESDMLLTKKQWEAVRERKAIDYEGSRWPEDPSDGYPKVPYVFSDSNVNKDAVKAGIAHWEEHTCVKFEETTKTDQAHLQFFLGGGCRSYVGLSSSTGQKISIGSRCESLGTVAHEIGHAMGFYHEQSRTDRDDHVVIKYDNIKENNKHNFVAHNANNYDVNYDYSSNMHYGSLYFTKNGKMTLVTKDPFAQELIASLAGLSHRDKLMANKMYKCIDKWLTKCGHGGGDPCKNEGYFGAKCACVCPTGTSGTYCETVSADYYAHLRNKETETITAEKTIGGSTGDSKFTKKIVAPTCKKVKLTFESFDLYKKITHNGVTYCYYEFVFLRFGKDLTEGNNYCAQEISAGQSFTSETNTMILYSESTHSGLSDGWTAKVEFVDDTSCTAATTIKPATFKPTTVVKCAKKSKTKKLKAGDAIEIQSSNYPNNYSNDKCLWKLKGDGAKNVKVSCSNFDLEAANKKGKCKDFLMIGGKKYCGDSGPVDVTVSVEKLTKLTFKANKKKAGKGFSCTVTALSNQDTTDGFFSTEGTVKPTKKPTAKPTKKPTTAKPTKPTKCKCGQKKVGTRIVNGKQTEVLEYPWQAGLVETGGTRTFCGGSLINSKWVLTAAHCTPKGTKASSIQVLLAEHDLTVSESHTERFSVVKIINHPKYTGTPWKGGHDISLLNLKGSVNFATSKARPICLPAGTSSYAGVVATLTGFGQIGANKPQSDYLREVDIDVISNAACAKSMGGKETDYKTMICAGKSDGSAGGCMGDSGGPLITKEKTYYVQIGIVSYGARTCDSYGVFCRVSDLKAWITRHTNTDNPDMCSP